MWPEKTAVKKGFWAIKIPDTKHLFYVEHSKGIKTEKCIVTFINLNNFYLNNWQNLPMKG